MAYEWHSLSLHIHIIDHAFYFSRLIDLYGDISPKLAEEDKKIFDLWMENWIEQRQNDFFFNFGNVKSLKPEAFSSPVN